MNPSEWRQAKSVIFGALSRPAGEREAYVARHCADPTLRAEIESLVADIKQSVGLLRRHL